MLPLYPAAFAAERGGSLRAEARALLAAADPSAPAPADQDHLRAMLRPPVLHSGIDAATDRLCAVLRRGDLHQPPLVGNA